MGFPYCVVLAYDGTDFGGWQSQSPRLAPRTVQGVLEEALTRLAGEGRIVVAGAGRTDAGAHALGQVAAFELPRPFLADELQRALNGLLPADVRVLEAAACPPGFHPRKDAVSKHYRYLLDTGPVQLPQRRRMAGHVPWTLDPHRVWEAAALFRGRHDFASLASSGSSVTTTVRTVTRSAATFEGTTLVYDVEADGFLRKMVRSMVGGLVEAGRGARTADDLRRALGERDRRAWPAPVDARGLTLVRVEYRPGALVT
jgi:tRNA pseudouridine38-40 synthase